MSSLEEYSKSNRSFPNARRKKQEHPKGWEPGLNTSKGEIVSKPLAKAIKPEDHRCDKYLEDLGFNPKDFEITSASNILLSLPVNINKGITILVIINKEKKKKGANSLNAYK